MRAKGAILLATAAACLLAAGCSDSSPPPDASNQVSVVERDFAIRAPASIDAGPVHLAIDNRGPDAHEFILVRADPSGLPLRADGMTVDEDAIEDRIIAAEEPALPGVREIDATLTPGRYLMICNMSGHLLGGMKRVLLVQ